MTDQFIWLVPTRNRPAAAKELLETFNDLSDGTSEIMFIVDDDDPQRMDYRQAVQDNLLVASPTWNGKGINFLLNNYSMYYAARYPMDTKYIGFMGDDHRPRTKGFDGILLNAMKELGSGIVYGDDLLQGELMPTAVAMTADIIRTLEYMSPPELTHLCLDVYWLKLGQGLDRLKYVPEVILEHMHPAAGKAELDAGYERVNSEAMMAKDGVVWHNFVLNGGIERDIERVKLKLGIE